MQQRGAKWPLWLENPLICLTASGMKEKSQISGWLWTFYMQLFFFFEWSSEFWEQRYLETVAWPHNFIICNDDTAKCRRDLTSTSFQEHLRERKFSNQRENASAENACGGFSGPTGSLWLSWSWLRCCPQLLGLRDAEVGVMSSILTRLPDSSLAHSPGKFHA